MEVSEAEKPFPDLTQWNRLRREAVARYNFREKRRKVFLLFQTSGKVSSPNSRGLQSKSLVDLFARTLWEASCEMWDTWSKTCWWIPDSDVSRTAPLQPPALVSVLIKAHYRPHWLSVSIDDKWFKTMNISNASQYKEQRRRVTL